MAFPNSWSRRAVYAAAAAVALSTTGAYGAPVFFGPSSYLSQADIPVGFYSSGSPDGLEDFEDLSLDFGIVASAGAPLGPAGGTDSVDGDDGVIDGSGLGGASFFSAFGPAGITFTFPSPVTAAGIVWTDGVGDTTFEAFSASGDSLGTIGPVAIATAGIQGQTDEDSFFGLQDLEGIGAIALSNTIGGIEVDHLQFGVAPVPLPAALWLLLGGVASLACFRRRRT